MKGCKRWLCLLLSLTLCLGILTPAALAAEPAGNDAGFYDMFAAEGVASCKELWTDDSMDTETLKALINSQELHPQRTGWKELDDLLESLKQKAGSEVGSDAYSQLWYMYDWLVKNVSYGWDGYTYTSASVRAYNSFGWNYLKSMTYEDGLQKAMPDDMANRTYHMLTYKKGVCYDYGIAITVMARYIGLESYVRTGHFDMEYAYDGNGHHGWSILRLDGKDYVFDPQRDARNWTNHKRTGYYFGISEEKAWRYDADRWQEDIDANAQRDAQMLPVTANRAHKVQVTASAVNGIVSGQGSYITGTRATLTAAPVRNYLFTGWYDAQGQLLSTDVSYTFTVQDAISLTARFEPDPHMAVCPSRDYLDVPRNAWYHEAVDYVVERDIMSGSESSFAPEATMTRGMLVQALWDSQGNPEIDNREFEDRIRARINAADGAEQRSAAVREAFVDWFVSEPSLYWWRCGMTYDPTAWYFTWSSAGNTRLNIRVYDQEMARQDETYAYTLYSLDWNGREITLTRDGQIVTKEQAPSNQVTIFTRDPEELWTAGYSDVFATGGYMDGYANAIRWASRNGIVNGYTDGTYKPNQLVSRQEMATILYRFADVYLHQDMTGGVSLENFPDGEQVGSYAQAAVEWAVGQEYIRGSAESNGQILLLPEGDATRAQTAMILMRFFEDLPSEPAA